ncbi:MAG: peptidylprolyl isomerase, partial [Deltaproteobacteria bacterium]|nr:peptidylprolyl isomerase [Deltaproteobacteria bacterium]MDA8123462.1 peptidylprolyl isomerase [Deltaproteobacteria bacterium]
YAVFGKVVEGMDVVDKIRNVPTGNQRMFQDVPKDPVTIIKASLIEKP